MSAVDTEDQPRVVIDAACTAAQHEHQNIANVTVLLHVLARHMQHPNLAMTEVDWYDLGNRFEYLADQLKRHAAALDDELERIEIAGRQCK